MKCECGSPTNIIDTREHKEEGGTWRKHRCKACGNVFTTLETICITKAWYPSKERKAVLREMFHPSLGAPRYVKKAEQKEVVAEPNPSVYNADSGKSVPIEQKDFDATAARKRVEELKEQRALERADAPPWDE